MSRLLLDTHAVLWCTGDDVGRLGQENIERLERATIVISAVSVWEATIKRRLGKLETPEELLPRLRGLGVELLSITPEHADLAGSLPLHHRDPFDRLLVAQALTEQLGLVTKDHHLARYGVEIVW